LQHLWETVNVLNLTFKWGKAKPTER
jgi:hypothetical protein